MVDILSDYAKMYHKVLKKAVKALVDAYNSAREKESPAASSFQFR